MARLPKPCRPHRWIRPSLIAAAGVSLLLGSGCSRDAGTLTSPLQQSDSASGPAISSGLVSAESPAFVAAIAAQNRATPGLLGMHGIVGTGTSADENGKPVVLVYTDRPGVHGIPDQVDGVATRVWNVGKVVAYAKPIRGPLPMGTSTGNDRECASGTLGCVVTKGGVDYFLSNNHVFARMNQAGIGERIDAPGRYDARPACGSSPACANLADFEPIQFQAGGNTLTNVIDAAIARPTRSYTSMQVSGYDPSSTIVEPLVGLAVKKTGRTSKLTSATVQAINVTIQVSYPTGVATFVQQIQLPGSFIRAGDSGSLMVTQSGNNPVGLCFAGSSQASFANPIEPVLQRFGVIVK